MHNNINTLMQTAHDAYDQGAFIQAQKYYREVTILAPRLEAGYFNLGNALMESNLWTEALSAYQQALKLNPHRPKTYNNIGLIYKCQQEWPKAIEWYLKALEINPDYYPACNNLGNIYQTLGQFEASEQWYERCLEIKPDHLNSKFNLACLYRDHELEAAAALYFRQIVETKDHAPAWCELGQLAENAGDTYLAAQCWQRALSADEKHIPSLIKLARLLRQTGKIEAANILYQQIQNWSGGLPSQN